LEGSRGRRVDMEQALKKAIIEYLLDYSRGFNYWDTLEL
jgi:hypothetical protein